MGTHFGTTGPVEGNIANPVLKKVERKEMGKMPPAFAKLIASKKTGASMPTKGGKPEMDSKKMMMAEKAMMKGSKKGK